MSPTAQKVFEGYRNITTHNTGSLDVHALVIVQGAGIGFADVDTTSRIFKFVSEITVNSFINGGLAVF